MRRRKELATRVQRFEDLRRLAKSSKVFERSLHQ